MQCDQVLSMLNTLAECVETHEGTRVGTHCLYPSFDPVRVFVVGFGGGFKVHDGGGAIRCAWDHGRNFATIRRSLKKQANIHRLDLVEDTLVATIPSWDWLVSAILSVANASAAAARIAVEHASMSTEDSLKERIEGLLYSMLPASSIVKDYEVAGRSGKKYGFDFAVRRHGLNWLLIDSVIPHHSSISSKYVAFSDTRDNDTTEGRFAVYDKPLDDQDAALLQQVTALVPFGSLPSGIRSRVAE